jgi:hypothetical protein
MKKVIEEINADPMIKKKDDDALMVRELCNKIQVQEDEKMSDIDLQEMKLNAPQGVAICLTLSIPYQRNPKEVSYLTLENDPMGGWSVCYYVDFGGTGQNKLKKRHDIDATAPNFIMTEFAKIYKAYLGKEAINLNK